MLFTLHSSLLLQHKRHKEIVGPGCQDADGYSPEQQFVEQGGPVFFFGRGARIREPPEENGLMALDCAPSTVQANSAPQKALYFPPAPESVGITQEPLHRWWN